MYFSKVILSSLGLASMSTGAVAQSYNSYDNYASTQQLNARSDDSESTLVRRAPMYEWHSANGQHTVSISSQDALYLTACVGGVCTIQYLRKKGLGHVIDSIARALRLQPSQVGAGALEMVTQQPVPSPQGSRSGSRSGSPRRRSIEYLADLEDLIRREIEEENDLLMDY